MNAPRLFLFICFLVTQSTSLLNTVNGGNITFEYGWFANSKTTWDLTNKMHSKWIKHFNTEWTAADRCASIKHVYRMAACSIQ